MAAEITPAPVAPDTIVLIHGLWMTHLAQAGRSHYGHDAMPDRLADGYGFRISLAGRGTVSLKLISNPQRPCGGSADRQVVGVQILKGAARLGDDGFHILLNDGQSGPYGGNVSYQVSGLLIRRGLLQGCFSRL
jgi:hypothetical protein